MAAQCIHDIEPGYMGLIAIGAGCDARSGGVTGSILELLGCGFEFFLLRHKSIHDYRIKMRP